MASRPEVHPNMRPYPRIDTTPRSAESRGNRNNTYSWVETPMELHNDRRNMTTRREGIPPLPAIPAIPAIPVDPGANQSYTYSQQASIADQYPPDQKANVQAPQSVSVPEVPHPEIFALQTPTNSNEQQPGQRTNTVESISSPSKIATTNGNQPKPIHNAQDSVANPRSPRTAPSHAFIPTYHPDAFAGPNCAPVDNHLPGQVPYPTRQVKGGKWKHGLLDLTGDMGTCCTGVFCPCILYGKTQYRLNRRSEKQDSTNMLGYETLNGSCMAMAVLCGFHWVLAGIQHARVRRTYHLPGTMGSDCAKAICCCCCTLIQDEREVKDREEQARQLSGTSKSTPYIPPGGMSYAPPPR